MEVLAPVNITAPAKECNVYELEKHKTSSNTHQWEDVYEKGLDKLSDFYGIDMRKLKRTIK